MAEEKDGRYQARNKETTGEWGMGVANGNRSQVGMTFHQQPLRKQKALERQKIPGREREDGEGYPPLWTSLW